MRDNTIEYKVKVFISSRCGGRYTIVRKALKELIEETNMAKVYMFEDSVASSQKVIPSYMTKLDDSDICIFLIDNKDGVSDAVLSEQKRARELERKSIYLFCDENQKEETQIQKEIINSMLEKITVVHEFCDFITIGYQSLLNDIINIYRNYCNGFFNNKDINTVESELDNFDFNSYTVNKSLLRNFDMTKSLLKSTIYTKNTENENTSFLDELCERLLSVIIGRNSIEGFMFNALLSELKKIHDDNIIEFIIHRWNAIKNYFNDNLDRCINNLHLAYNESISNPNIPNWLTNDVLIDLRNMQFLLDDQKSQRTIENEGQKLINENKETVYYPLIDRLETNLKKEVLKKSFKHNTDTPYTTSFDGLDNVYDPIANIFVVAVFYGSLTHILGTRERLIEVLSNISFIYNDHSIYTELILNLILSQKDKEIKRISRAYNQTTEMINEVDVEKMYNCILTISIGHKKFISMLILFKYFGFYFSDKMFSKISTEILNKIKIWLNNDKRVFSVSTYIFKGLLANIKRLDNNIVSEIIILIFRNGLKRWYDDALKIVQALDYKSLSKRNIISIIEYSLEIVSQEDLRNSCNSLTSVIINIRKKCNLKTAEIDNYVKKYMESFYKNNYSLEVFTSEENSVKHIDRFIKEIHRQNEIQGENGTYHGWAGSPQLTILNIIRYDKLDLQWKEIISIIEAIEETVFKERQTISSKIDSIQLLMFLNNNFSHKELSNIFERWIKKEEKIMKSHEVGIFDKATLETLRFNIMMLKVCFGINIIDDLLISFSRLTQQNDIEKIEALKAMIILLKDRDLSTFQPIILTTILQFTIGMSFHKERDVRLNALKLLFILCKSSYYRTATMQISKMMDNENYIIKANIINRIDTLKKYDKEIAELVVQKGKADNHYMIRKLSSN